MKCASFHCVHNDGTNCTIEPSFGSRYQNGPAECIDFRADEPVVRGRSIFEKDVWTLEDLHAYQRLHGVKETEEL